MKKVNIGIIAHVDSGKTTLTEALLYQTGNLRTWGRVDKGSSYLDNNQIERQRGITVFSKMIRLEHGNTSFTFIDTPGHADFSAETERALSVIDYALLIIGANDGIKGQSEFLWDMLKRYNIPVFIFINKMDQAYDDRQSVIQLLQDELSDAVVDFSVAGGDQFYEQVAMCSNEVLEEYAAKGSIEWSLIRKMILRRQIFPCLSGSALHMEGTERLLEVLDQFTCDLSYPEDFSARVYKIASDNDGTRLTFAKITGGNLRVKTPLSDGESTSRINQIRLYSGDKYTLTDQVNAGEICVLTGPRHSFAGQSLGSESKAKELSTRPLMTYRAIPPENVPAAEFLKILRQLEEEIPELSVRCDAESGQVYISVLGSVQLEVLSSLIKERFLIDITFDEGKIIYLETITEPVVGVGHFEPLRHYAEVHLLLEPLPAGSGIVIKSALGGDALAANWQSQILNTLKETRLCGALTGSLLTDMQITLINGKADTHHTGGGDFKEAALRALRQGLLCTKSRLLEPYFRFSLQVPSANAGRALNDLSNMNAQMSAPENDDAKNICTISGRVSAGKISGYPVKLNTYTKGSGRINLVPDGYDQCVDAEDVIASIAYDPENDIAWPAGSVFCIHGAGRYVPYNEVYSHAHLPVQSIGRQPEEGIAAAAPSSEHISLGTEEIDRIIASFTSANSRDKKPIRKNNKSVHVPAAGQIFSSLSAPAAKKLPAPFAAENARHFLIDGYNVIFAWEDLSDLTRINIDAARDALCEILVKFSSITDADITVVFDAYRTQGQASSAAMGKLQIVYSAENETADQYIERLAHATAGSRKTVVVTSDGTEQVVALGQGCRILSSREFRIFLDTQLRQFNERYHISQSDN